MSKSYKFFLFLVLVALVTAMPEAYNRNKRSPDPHKRRGYWGGHRRHHGYHGGYGNYGGYEPNWGHGGGSQSSSHAQAGSIGGFGGSYSYASAYSEAHGYGG